MAGEKVMPNLGVYVAAGPNPIFLRMFLLQLERQTRLPNVLSIYENGHKVSAMGWAGKDILEKLQSRGVRILHTHDAQQTNEVNWYFRALERLVYETDVDVFLKMDLDDFYKDTYIANMEEILGINHLAINQNSGIALIRPFKGDFKYTEAVMKHSPMGAAPTHVSFNRVFAEKYLGYLKGNVDNDNTADDELMAECLIGAKVNRVDGPMDYVYVSHGTNHSSYAWQSTGGRVYFGK